MRGAPVWAYAAGAALAVITILVVLRRLDRASSAESFDAAASHAYAARMMEAGNFDATRAELEKVARHRDEVPAELAARFAALEAELGAIRDAARTHFDEADGDAYLGSQIRAFEDRWVQPALERAYVRVLLKRCAHFRATWPGHPATQEVEQREERYGAVVSLADPPTYADVEVEARALTWARPREYRQCFEVLSEFLASASGDDRVRCEALIEEKRREQEAHFDERMREVDVALAAGDEGTAVAELVSIVTRFDDDALEGRAADALVRLPRIASWLEAYRRDSERQWVLLVENATVAAKSRELGLL